MEKSNEDFFVELVKAKESPVKIYAESPENAEKKLEENKNGNGEEGTLTVDVYDDGDNIIVISTVAGVNDDDLVVDITPEMVTIKGERKMDKKISEENYLYQELFWGKFSRSIILPEEVSPDDSEASLTKGILTIKMPKARRPKSKQIKVKSEE